MENRDSTLLAIRPKLNIENVQTQIFETFQNETLRPILKLQNTLIINILMNTIRKNKIDLSQLSANQKVSTIQNIIFKNQSLKNLLNGFIIGLFTQAEYDFWEAHHNELNKRIQILLLERILSQI